MTLIVPYHGSLDAYRFDDVVAVRDRGMGKFSPDQMLEIFILARCDVLPSINNVGMKKAVAYTLRLNSYEKVEGRPNLKSD